MNTSVSETEKKQTNRTGQSPAVKWKILVFKVSFPDLLSLRLRLEQAVCQQ